MLAESPTGRMNEVELISIHLNPIEGRAKLKRGGSELFSFPSADLQATGRRKLATRRLHFLIWIVEKSNTCEWPQPFVHLERSLRSHDRVPPAAGCWEQRRAQRARAPS